MGVWLVFEGGVGGYWGSFGWEEGVIGMDMGSSWVRDGCGDFMIEG